MVCPKEVADELDLQPYSVDDDVTAEVAVGQEQGAGGGDCGRRAVLIERLAEQSPLPDFGEDEGAAARLELGDLVDDGAARDAGGAPSNCPPVYACCYHDFRHELPGSCRWCGRFGRGGRI